MDITNIGIKITLFISFIICNETNESIPCKNFKTGQFEINFENSDFKYSLTRNAETQVEINPDGNKVYYSIEWLDDCKYLAKFDSNKMALNEEMKLINSDGGIIVELENLIDEKCISYTSYVKNHKDISIRKGTFCKK